MPTEQQYQRLLKQLQESQELRKKLIADIGRIDSTLQSKSSEKIQSRQVSQQQTLLQLLNKRLKQAAKQEEEQQFSRHIIKPGVISIQKQHPFNLGPSSQSELLIHWQPIPGCNLNVRKARPPQTRSCTGIHPNHVIRVLSETLGISRDKIKGKGTTIAGMHVYLKDIPQSYRKRLQEQIL